MVEIYVDTGCVISQFNSDCQQNLKNIYTLVGKSYWLLYYVVV